MRICYFTHGNKQEGSSISLLNLIRGVSNAGHTCFVILPQKGYLCDKLDEFGVKWKIHSYRWSTYPQLKKNIDYVKFIPRLALLLINLFNFRRIEKTVLKFNPDIIHSNVSVIQIGYKIAKKNSIKHIWHIREYVDKDFHFNFFPSKKTYLKKIHNSFTISITKDLFNYFKLSDDNAIVIYNGVELSVKKKKYRYPKQSCFLFVGHVTETKGVFFLIDAYREYCNKVENPIDLIIIGKCLEVTKNIIRDRIDNLVIYNHVHFLGEIPKEQVLEYMQKCLAIIVPSYFEAFGRITAEAMFNGCLVIGRNTGGTKEQFDNGKICTAQEIGLRFCSLSELVAWLCVVPTMSKEEYQTIVKSALETVMKLYTIENNVLQTLNFYKFVLSR